MADALANPKSVAAALSSLTISQFEQLDDISEGRKQNSGSFVFDLMLAEKSESNQVIFQSTVDAMTAIRSQRKVASLSSVGADSFSFLPADSIDRDASLAIFDIIQALTELIFELEQRYIREVGKRGVGLPDIKRLANHLRKPNDYSKQVFELAQFTNLAEVEGGRWQLGQRAENWISWTDRERWIHLTNTWLALLGDEAAGELLAIRAGESFDERLAHVYPFADSTASNRIKKVAEIANLIGLIANSQATSWLNLLSANSIDAASVRAIAG